MRSAIALLLVSPLYAQMTSIRRPVAVAVSQYRPVQTFNGNFVQPQSGSGPDYGIALESGAAGSSVQVTTYGEAPCEFDGPPVVGFTAVALNGFCHYSPSIVNDSDVLVNQSAIGRIMSLRPDLGPNFAMVNHRIPAGRGSMITSALITDFDAAVKAHQNPGGTAGPKGDTGAVGQSAFQAAQAGGFSGTQAQWLASLIGPAGQNGSNGSPGTNGSNGSPGQNGSNGSTPANPNFTASASTLTAGATATASVSGTYPNLGISFGIPSGANGTNGTNGSNGVSPANPAFTASASSLASTASATATITGTYPNLALSFGIPAGSNGSTPANPAFAVSASGLAAGAAPTAVLSGTYPNLSIAFGIPSGAAGTNGTSPANPVFTPTAAGLAAGASPTATITGTYPNLALALGIPAGATGTAASISIGAVTTGACGSSPTVTNTGTSAAAVLAFTIPSCTTLSGTTASIGGAALLVGATTTGTVTIAGATVGKNCQATASDGSLPTGGMIIDCAVTSTNTATVQIRALVAVTPPAKTYLVQVLP